MNQGIYLVNASVSFAVVLGACFLFLCPPERFRKKHVALGFNFGVALIVAGFLLFVVEAGLR
jgi:hypothetical protein